MAVSSILAICALTVASIVAAFTLLTEKPEVEQHQSLPRRFRKVILYVLTFLTLLLGSWQIRKADNENRAAEQARRQEHDGDQQQIIQLQQSVFNLFTNLRQETKEAEAKGNTRLATSLRDQITTLQKETDSASASLLLLAAPDILKEMQSQATEWSSLAGGAPFER
jgi:hypothetical protein